MIYSRAELDADAVRACLAEVRENVAAACRRSGRDPGSVEVLAATKYVTPGGMEVLAEAGITLVGENREQDLGKKHRRLGDSFTWDFIGRLQSNKVRRLLPRVRLVHSVATLSAVKEIEARAEKKTEVLLQVNIGQEASKCGIIPAETDRFLEEAERFSMVDFIGLMTMPPLTADPEEARPAFAALRSLAERLTRQWQGRYQFRHLSMGTSNDYIPAVEEGATIVRVGSVLLGRR